MRVVKYLVGRSKYQPWWEEALYLVLDAAEDAWEWARGLVARPPSPRGDTRDDELARQAIAQLAYLARQDRR